MKSDQIEWKYIRPYFTYLKYYYFTYSITYNIQMLPYILLYQEVTKPLVVRYVILLKKSHVEGIRCKGVYGDWVIFGQLRNDETGDHSGMQRGDLGMCLLLRVSVTC